MMNKTAIRKYAEWQEKSSLKILNKKAGTVGITV